MCPSPTRVVSPLTNTILCVCMGSCYQTVPASAPSWLISSLKRNQMRRSAASAMVGMHGKRRRWASGSPPTRASLRLVRACSRASASETSATAPSPGSRRRPRMTSRCIPLQVPAAWTNRYNPLGIAFYSGSANTNRLLPELGRSSGVRRRFTPPPAPVLTATYWRPPTA